jgi:RNA polymerase-binding transcription factor DksA
MNTDAHKDTLTEELATLTEELSQLATKDEAGIWHADPEDIDPSESDENTVADRFENYEEKSALVQTLATRLSEVETALGAIAHGGYGICRVCANPIEEARLAANPAATTCMKHLDA